MDAKYFWEAVRSDGKVVQGYAESPEEARLYRIPGDQDFVFVPRPVRRRPDETPTSLPVVSPRVTSTEEPVTSEHDPRS